MLPVEASRMLICVCELTQLGLARTIYIRCIHGVFGREATKYTVIYGVCIYGYTVLANPRHSA